MASLGGPKNTGAGFWTVPHRCKYAREGLGGSGALQGGSTGAGETAAWRGSGDLCGSKTSVELPVHSQPMTPQNGEIATTGASPRSTSTPFASGQPWAGWSRACPEQHEKPNERQAGCAVVHVRGNSGEPTQELRPA